MAFLPIFSKGSKIKVFGESLKKKENQETNVIKRNMECSICLDIISNKKYISKCGHCFCQTCIILWILNEFIMEKSRTCPNCRNNIEEDIIRFEFTIDVSFFSTNNSRKFIELLEYHIIQKHDICNKMWIKYVMPKRVSKNVKINTKSFFESLMLKQ